MSPAVSSGVNQGVGSKKERIMQFPIAIHKDDGSVYRVTVPDVPGCYSCGDTIDEAITNAREAIYGHVEVLLDLGETVDLCATSVS